MCDAGGGGGGGGGGFGGGGGGGGLDLSGLGNLDLSGLGTIPLIEPITAYMPDSGEIINAYADKKANEFAGMYDEKRTNDALTKGYFANARKIGIAEDVNASLQSIFDNETSRKETAKQNYKNSIKNKYANYDGTLPPDALDSSIDPLDMTDINDGLVENVDDGTRTATLGGARRFVGRLAPKLFGGENLKPIDTFRTRRRFQKDDDGGTSGTLGFKNFNFNQRRADD